MPPIIPGVLHQGLNRSVERLEPYTGEVDKRVVRLETLTEIAGTQRPDR